MMNIHIGRTCRIRIVFSLLDCLARDGRCLWALVVDYVEVVVEVVLVYVFDFGLDWGCGLDLGGHYLGLAY